MAHRDQFMLGQNQASSSSPAVSPASSPVESQSQPSELEAKPKENAPQRTWREYFFGASEEDHEDEAALLQEVIMPQIVSWLLFAVLSKWIYVYVFIIVTFCFGGYQEEEKKDDEDAEARDLINTFKNMTGLWDIDPDCSE